MVILDEFNPPTSGLTVPLWVACGGELKTTSVAGSLKPCSAGLNFLANGQTFDKGITFLVGALSAHSGGATPGDSWAVNLPTHYDMRWEFPGNNTASFITSTVDTVGDTNGLVFGDFGALFLDQTGATMALISRLPDPSAPGPIVNFPQMNPSSTGNPVIFEATGTDTNTKLSLLAKGGFNGAILAGNPFLLLKIGVSNLPTCNAALEGAMAAIVDATTAVFNANITTGGGTNHIIGYCTGTNWTVH